MITLGNYCKGVSQKAHDDMHPGIPFTGQSTVEYYWLIQGSNSTTHLTCHIQSDVNLRQFWSPEILTEHTPSIHPSYSFDEGISVIPVVMIPHQRNSCCAVLTAVTSFSTNRHNFEGLLKLLRIVDAEEMLPSHEYDLMTTKF
jgi:hypothetical protein